MNKKWIFIFCFALLSRPIFAETCPSVYHIKHQTLHGFKMVDSNSDKPLETKRIALFRNKVKEFVLAEWTTTSSHKNGMIHCYYRDHDGSELETYLVKEHFTPENSNNFWYAVSGAMHCAANINQCIFQTTIQQQQLAKK